MLAAARVAKGGKRRGTRDSAAKQAEEEALRPGRAGDGGAAATGTGSQLNGSGMQQAMNLNLGSAGFAACLVAPREQRREGARLMPLTLVIQWQQLPVAKAVATTTKAAITTTAATSRRRHSTST